MRLAPIMEALYAAKAARPSLDIAVLVDWHRAQRGLIGERRRQGNKPEMPRGIKN
jgi:CDP-diacylglycerol--serine O-phosphatidyltransferase